MSWPSVHVVELPVVVVFIAGPMPLTPAGTRVGRVQRKTKETDVDVSIGLDGTGMCSSATGIPFLDHMMDVSEGAKGGRTHTRRLRNGCE